MPSKAPCSPSSGSAKRKVSARPRPSTRQARVCLERLCNEARCTDFDGLAEADRRSQSLIRLEGARATCDEQLMVTAAGADLTEFCHQVEQADPTTLDASIEELETTMATQEEELRRLDQTIGAERGELARMDGSDRAALAAEEAQTLLARLQGDVARYATLKLAATVMQRGIERYREKNQGPILARAGVLFAGLTSGSFARLQIDEDGDGHSVLKGVRPDGRLVGVEGMSDGSHDQLYLALRLASLESWLQSHEPVPFVVDDILLNFDDVRATAALALWPSCRGEPRSCFLPIIAISSSWPVPRFPARLCSSMNCQGHAPRVNDMMSNIPNDDLKKPELARTPSASRRSTPCVASTCSGSSGAMISRKPWQSGGARQRAEASLSNSSTWHGKGSGFMI